MTALERYEKPDRKGALQITASNVACEVRLRHIDRKHGIAAYEIALANKTASDVSCRLFALDGRNVATDLVLLHVAAHSVGGSYVGVPLQACRSDAAIHVEILGGGLCVRSQTHVPRQPRFSLGQSLAASIVAATALVLTLIFMTAAFRPTVLLAAPLEVHPGIASATYAFERGMSASYSAVGADGTVLGEGALTNAKGFLVIRVPDAMVGQKVRLKLEAHGPFGVADESVAFAVSALQKTRSHTLPAASSTARIVALTAHREAYAGTSSVLASYFAVAKSGTLFIRDARGRSIAQVPFAHAGTTRIALPSGLQRETLRAELAVTRGTSHATAYVELPPESVAPIIAPVVESPLASNLTSEASGAPPPVGGDSIPQPSDPFSVGSRAVGGTAVEVIIRRRLPDMRVALQDEIGTTLDERDIPAGARTIHLNVPAVSAVETLYIACTFTREASEETLVRSLRVFPH